MGSTSQASQSLTQAQGQSGQVLTTGASVGGYSGGGTIAGSTSLTTGVSISSPYWGTIASAYIPTIDPKSIINGTEIKVEDLVTRLAELEEKFKNLKFQMELMKP